MKSYRMLFIILWIPLVFLIVVYALLSCDNDSGSGGKDEDSTCIMCQSTDECYDSLGKGWVCVDGCCEDLGGDDNDGDDDSDDDTGDDDDDDDDDDSVDNDDDAGDLNDNGDGTATDPNTSLTWQIEAPELFYYHGDAYGYCLNLMLGGYDDWLMPTISELRSIVRGCDETKTGGTCGVTDECFDSECWDWPCMGCSRSNGPNDGCYWAAPLEGLCDAYWSRTPQPGYYYDDYWIMDFDAAYIRSASWYYLEEELVRCVRSPL